MERNQSTLGRIFRISGGLFVLSLSLLGPQAIWGLLGIVPLVSGLTGFDPVYGILAVLGRSLVRVPTALHTRL
jgi:hypothetical protein